MDRNLMGSLLPPALAAEIETMAAAEGRPVGDMLREAVEQFLQDRRTPPSRNVEAGPKRTPRDAATRIRERRMRHPLPEGMSIRDLTTYGRA